MSSSNGYATREQIFENAKRRFKDVMVGGAKVRIRSLTESEWADIEVGNLDLKRGGSSQEGIKTSDVRLLIATVVDGNGEPVFNALDVSQLCRLDAAFVVPLVREVRQHCGLSSSVEDAEKNSVTTGGEGSPCSSSGQPQPVESTG